MAGEPQEGARAGKRVRGVDSVDDFLSGLPPSLGASQAPILVSDDEEDSRFVAPGYAFSTLILFCCPSFLLNLTLFSLLHIQAIAWHILGPGGPGL